MSTWRRSCWPASSPTRRPGCSIGPTCSCGRTAGSPATWPATAGCRWRRTTSALRRSDQYEAGHPLQAEDGPLGAWVRQLRERVDDYAYVNQFIRAFSLAPAPAAPAAPAGQAAPARDRGAVPERDRPHPRRASGRPAGGAAVPGGADRRRLRGRAPRPPPRRGAGPRRARAARRVPLPPRRPRPRPPGARRRSRPPAQRRPPARRRSLRGVPRRRRPRHRRLGRGLPARRAGQAGPGGALGLRAAGRQLQVRRRPRLRGPLGLPQPVRAGVRLHPPPGDEPDPDPRVRRPPPDARRPGDPLRRVPAGARRLGLPAPGRSGRPASSTPGRSRPSTTGGSSARPATARPRPRSGTASATCCCNG